MQAPLSAGPAVPLLGCATCRRVFATPNVFKEHLASPLHAKRVAFEAKQGDVPNRFKRCDTCGTDILDKQWSRHVNSARHANAQRFKNYQAAREKAQSDQGGVEILPGELDFGFVEFKAFTPKTEHSNKGLKHFSVQSFSDRPLRINPYKTARIPVHFTPRNTIGTFDDVLVLTLYLDSSSASSASEPVTIHRTVRGQVGCKSDIEQHGPKEPYVPRAQRPALPRATEQDTVKAPKNADSAFKQNVPWTGRLPAFFVWPWLKEILEEHPVGEAIQRVKQGLPRFDYEGYSRYWLTLLHAERVQEDLDIHGYDMEATRLQRGPNRTCYLDVPGLAEKRPSVLRGDRIKVRGTGGTGRWFEGAVTAIELSQVALRFHNSFNPGAAATFDIQFTLSSIPSRRQMQALCGAKPRKELLFPTPGASYPGRPAMHDIMGHHRFFSPEVEANPHQAEAVLSIFYRSHGKAPYIIFGPPGTGKTVTLIEPTKQLFHYIPSSILLLTAPSNAAADLLCSRLALDPSVVLRLNAPSRAPFEVPPEVKPYCFELENSYACPPLQQLKTYRIIIATTITASILGGVGLPKGHFTHLITDEAGQATEPSTFLPLSLAGESANVILAGDPKQLGPIIRSPVASRFGLDTSLLERLMKHPDFLDSNHAMRGTTYSKLIRNYRNHPAILKLPNELFYLNELETRARAKVTDRLATWTGWPARGFPILFHSVRGMDEREGRSPSFFNVAEISVVKTYVESLQNRSGRANPRDADIGVITPYASQVKKLTAALKKPDMTVGTVEQFQGSERSMIIMSTVRSNQDYLAHDKKHAIGFLDNPKRFNVALTRAQSGLIIVGDPDLLALDPMWRKFLLYAYDNGGWAGQDWDAEAFREEDVDPERRAREEMEAFVKSFSLTKLDDLDRVWK
ncbi:hypothetical protein JCM11641_004085 [Rhodosporidiobolus odoratus]